jgi:hypothetical protein
MPRVHKTAVADSDTEMISPPRKTLKKAAAVSKDQLSDVDMESAEDTAGDDNESETADDEYVVQQIMKHKFNGEVCLPLLCPACTVDDFDAVSDVSCR